MSSEGFDTSFNPPTGAEAAAAGLRKAMLYITPPGPGNKGVTQALWDDYAAHGIEVGLIWEEGGEAVLGGRRQGVEDAKAAQACLHALHGPSDLRPLYFAIDFDIQPYQYALADAYFSGVNSVIGLPRSGGYGSHDILAHLTAQRRIVKRWQTVAWSNGLVFSPLDVLQYENSVKIGSGEVDRDRFFSANWGQIAVEPPHAPAPRPQPVVYVVKPGDTLSGIAGHFGISWTALYGANRHVIGADPGYIVPGERLVIPKP